MKFEIINTNCIHISTWDKEIYEYLLKNFAQLLDKYVQENTPFESMYEYKKASLVECDYLRDGSFDKLQFQNDVDKFNNASMNMRIDRFEYFFERFLWRNITEDIKIDEFSECYHTCICDKRYELEFKF